MLSERAGVKVRGKNPRQQHASFVNMQAAAVRPKCVGLQLSLCFRAVCGWQAVLCLTARDLARCSFTWANLRVCRELGSVGALTSWPTHFSLACCSSAWSYGST